MPYPGSRENKSRFSASAAARIALFYAAFSLVWIFGSDRLLGVLIWDRESLTTVQSFKGSVFVLITSILIYLLIRRAIHQVENSEASLREALKAREDFLVVASHELKTPLTSLSLQVQLAARELKRLDPAVLADTHFEPGLKLSIRQIRRLTALVNDLLDMSRVVGGQLRLQPSFFNLATLASDCVSLLSEQFRTSGVEVRIGRLDEATGCWDRERMEQVILNVLSNALKYGGGSPIQVELRATPEVACLEIRDGGRGIAEADLERIFRKFERAVPSSEVSGLGLGLYISREIVERHRGTITVLSEKGRGALFIIRLPRAQEESLLLCAETAG